MTNQNNPHLSDAERAERDDLVECAKTADDQTREGTVKLASSLHTILQKQLFREGARTFDSFVETTFDFGRDLAYKLARLGACNAHLEAADEDPLDREAHGREVAPLLDDKVALVDAVRRARALAAVEGVGLCARHLKAARQEVERETHVEESPDQAAVLAYEGLLVKVTVEDGAEPPDDAVAQLPGAFFVPYDDGFAIPDPPEPEVDADPFVRLRLDDVTDQVWMVVTADPFSAPDSLTLPQGPLRAMFDPEQLSFPRLRLTADADDRDRTVIVGPGVDVLNPDFPKPVAWAIVEAAGNDPGRRYLLPTGHPDRAWDGSPNNVFLLCEADRDYIGIQIALGDRDDRAAITAPIALVLRDFKDPIEPDALEGIVWVLVRGRKTTQAALDSIRAALSDDQALDIGREVKARFSGYPALPTVEPVVEVEPVVDVGAPELDAGGEDAGERPVVDETVVDKTVVDETEAGDDATEGTPGPISGDGSPDDTASEDAGEHPADDDAGTGAHTPVEEPPAESAGPAPDTNEEATEGADGVPNPGSTGGVPDLEGPSAADTEGADGGPAGATTARERPPAVSDARTALRPPAGALAHDEHVGTS